MSKFVAITPPNETIAMIAGPGGETYPLVNYEYAIVSTRQPSAARAKLVRDFLSWVISPGNAPALVSQVNFQPLPADIQKLSRRPDRTDPLMAATIATPQQPPQPQAQPPAPGLAGGSRRRGRPPRSARCWPS